MSVIKLVLTAAMMGAIAVAFYAGTRYMDAHHGRFPVFYFVIQLCLGGLAGPLVGSNLKDWREMKRNDSKTGKQNPTDANCAIHTPNGSHPPQSRNTPSNP